MKIWLRENWFKLFIAISVIFIFYWVEIRPSFIRKECRNKAEDSVNRVWPIGDYSREDEPRLYDIFYQNCIKGIYGLEK